MDGASEPEVDFTKLPIDERCLHKNWKARLSGYEELLKLYQLADDEKAPEFSKYASIVKKIPVDSMAAAQEKGLASVYAFVELAAPNVSGKIAGDVLSGVVNKCLVSSKAKTKELAGDIVLMYIEVEKHDVVIEELTKGLENKSPKIVCACIQLLRDALNRFGPKVIKPGPLIKIVQAKIEDRDKNVRDETKLLAIEIYRWLKDAFKPQLSNVKPVALAELDAEFAKIKDEKAQVTRFLRSEQARVQVNGSGGDVVETDGQTASVPVQEDIDPFELLEPVEILNKLPSDFYTLCESKKWQERKQAIEQLQELLTPNPKLAAGDYGELVKVLKKFIQKDTNINVVASAAKALADLASRLRKAFHSHAHSCIAVILEKFKEKKMNVVTALREAIDACMLSSSLEAIQEDVVAALDNKNPQIKAETASVLTRQFAISTPAVVGNKKLLKVLLTSLIKTLNDMDGGVRDAAAEAIGTASKVNGDKLMTPFLADVDPIKMAKIKEYCDKAEVKYPAPPGGHAPARPMTGKVSTSASALQTRAGSNSSLGGSSEDVRPKPKLGAKAAPKSAGMKKQSSLPAGVTAKTVTRPKTGGAPTPTIKNVRRPSTGIAERKEEKVSNGGIDILPVNKMKDTRLADEKALRVLKWNFTAPREEFYVQLKEQMQDASWNDALVANAFHADFKYHLKAIAEIQDYLNAGNTPAIIANSDLILKWAALRFFDTNPSVILKCLELITSIFVAFKDAGRQLPEPEAVAFFPYLVLKAGDPKDVVRNKVQEIFEKAREIYAPTKLFVFIMNGLATKNSRQRAMCLDKLADLVEQYGLPVCQPPHPGALKEIAKQISDRDNGVRNSALNCVVQFYLIEGEKVKDKVGKLNDKDMGMLEERIKRVSKNRPPPAKISPQAAPAAASGLRPPGARIIPGIKKPSPPKERTPSPEEEEDAYVQTYDIKREKADVTRSRTITKRPSLQRPMTINANDMEQDIEEEPASPVKEAAYQPMPAMQPQGEMKISQKLAILRQQKQATKQQPLATVVPHVQHVHHDDDHEDMLITDVELPKRRPSAGYASSPPRDLGYVAKMVQLSNKDDVALSMVMAQLSSHDIPKTIEAFGQLKELLNRPDRAEQYLSSKVDQIISLCCLQYRLCIIKHLADNDVPREDVINLFKAITSILDSLFKHQVLRKLCSRDCLRELMPQVIHIILESRLTEAPEGPAVIKTVNLLATCIIINADATNMMCSLIRLLCDCISGTVGASNVKFTEMVMKCLWKMIRFIEQYVDELNIDKVLGDIHRFMQQFPSEHWKQPGKGDTPLRTVKTITYLLTQNKGVDMLNHLSEIPDPKGSELVGYINRALKHVHNGNESPVPVDNGTAENGAIGHANGAAGNVVEGNLIDLS